MGRKHGTICGRIFATLLSLALILNGIVWRPVIAFATGEEQGNSENAKVTNLSWKEGSTATATWDAFEGANYYEVEVFVYYEDKLVGSDKTGTYQAWKQNKEFQNYVVDNVRG